MSESKSPDVVQLEARLWAARNEIATLRGMFTGFAAIVVAAVLIAAIVTPLTITRHDERSPTSNLGEVISGLMQNSGRPDFGFSENLTLGLLVGIYVVVVVALVSLLLIAMRAVSRWGVIAVRIIGMLLIVAVLGLWAAQTQVTDADEINAGPAIWVLVAGTVLYSILVFAKDASSLWGPDR
ncbi:hypothetical protein [Microbacterium sp. MPKO10]|uniref:hypothetical protein n=1 Tax=Microbacterium sp. MPKO10 TaxID=2989818 RepID=UPI002235F44F|nr:hypothetical protein [Microbacterium sp. MPKO10]MCW4458591.1 hypothetical protein [Microbacterium sp. MPKO10]